ncbi:hypothetical protein ULG90_00585 [Halopseudomonas pachastrellae]|nr:hypothetical protein ULG90_00585 [Halopseudomonas pachastrellae]
MIFNGENRKTKSGTLARAVLLDSSANGGNDIRSTLAGAALALRTGLGAGAASGKYT